MPSGILKTAYPWASTPLEHLGVAGRAPKTRESKKKLYTGRIADENDSDLRYLEVPPKGKNKTLVKILGGGDPCNPCGVDAYERIDPDGARSEVKERDIVTTA